MGVYRDGAVTQDATQLVSAGGPAPYIVLLTLVDLVYLGTQLRQPVARLTAGRHLSRGDEPFPSPTRTTQIRAAHGPARRSLGDLAFVRSKVLSSCTVARGSAR